MEWHNTKVSNKLLDVSSLNINYNSISAWTVGKWSGF